jgi:hypothetical protein
MKVVSNRTIKYEEPIKLYDIRNTKFHNFIIKGKTNEFVSHNCSLLDECNFGANPKNLKESQSQMMKIYSETKARQKSRFTRDGGRLPTMMFLVSSKKSELDFLDRYTQKVKDDPSVYIVDKPIWEIKPRDRFAKETFKVGVGNKNLESIILPDDADVDSYIKQGYEILDVPMNFKDDFKKNMENSLMAIAGVSLSSALKFISPRRYDSCVVPKTKRQNPFTSEVLTIGLDDDLQIKDFFKPFLVPKSLIQKPLFIHIDSSLKGDITGLSCVAIVGAAEYDNEDTISKLYFDKGVPGYSNDEDEDLKNVELHYADVFTIGIKAPSNSEISLEKTRQFIYYLRKQNWNIKGISIDGFQSADTRQILTTRGFDCQILSLDRTPEGYTQFRAAINENRIEILELEGLRDEAINVEKNMQTGKVDHTSEGSKDKLDSLAGALWNASLYKGTYVYNYGVDIESAILVNNNMLDAQTQIKVQLNQSLVDIKTKEEEDEIRRQIAKLVERSVKDNEVINVSEMSDKEKEVYAKQILKQAETNTYRPSALIDDGIIVF